MLMKREMGIAPSDEQDRGSGDSPFDAIAAVYEEKLNDAISISGFSSSAPARMKMKVIARIRNRIAPDGHVRLLDFGCGIGMLARQFAGFMQPGDRYYGIDESSAAIKRCQKAFPEGFRFGTPDRPPYEKGESFDIVVAAGVFHHIDPEKRASVLKDLAVLVAPRGVCVIWEHNPLNPVTRWIVGRCSFDQDAHLVHARSLCEILRRAGFQNIRRRYTTFFPRLPFGLNRVESWLGWCPLGGQYYIEASR